MKSLLLISMLLCGNAWGKYIKPGLGGVHNLLQIVENKQNMSSDYALRIHRAAVKASNKHEVPLGLILAIAFVESSYKLGAVNKSSNDYGIMQVNSWHIDRSNLDKQRLLTDMDYSFDQGTKILKWFYDTYPLEEAIKRYNCGTRKNCINWKKVKKYLDKVQKAM
jgi:soluble lytic murein transglycosylase-like protein